MVAKPKIQNFPLIANRPPSTVMKLARLGSFHQTRLSFMRVLLRRLKSENWRFKLAEWRIDCNGVGLATYEAIGPERIYTLVVFTHDLPAEKRSDRVIAEAWDATFTLHDGVISERDLNRLQINVPLQEAGRISGQEFILSRANKSVRLFNYVSNCLASGMQPNINEIEAVGYLMRTTAVYGSGKFGAADRKKWFERPEFAGAFQPELLSVWLIRNFTIDLVEHIAKQMSPQKAVRLNPEIRRRIGVGNSTGLGMAPFLLNHPALIHSWIFARETALSRVRSIQRANKYDIKALLQLTQRALQNTKEWKSTSDYQTTKIESLRKDLKNLLFHLQGFKATSLNPYDAIYEWGASNLSLEGQEQLVSLLLEGQGSLIDDLAENMSADEMEHFHIDGSMTIAKVKWILKTTYSWIDGFDFNKKHNIARVWYVSAEKLEPRLGTRFEEPIEPYEQPLSPARDAAALRACLGSWDDDETVANFLLKNPEHRHIIRRIQVVAKLPYAEIRDNTISADLRPIDLLRCKLSFFGASKFDPRSDRWLRITMFQGAPFPDELDNLDPDELAYPPLYS